MIGSFAGKRVVLGVSGGIAAYKAVEVCRRLVDAGAHVSVILTEDAHRFIGPVTFSALSSEPVHTSLWDDSSPIPHTTLGQRADLVVVAPATARVLSAYASGYSHDLLSTTLIATRAPVIVCPAMHTEMWEHPAVRHNLEVLTNRGVIVVEPQTGRLAGGDTGAGRLADPETIVTAISRALGSAPTTDIDLVDVKVMVTAGGTREAIDAVRVIANRSSGKQGYAIAEEAARRGARVTLISTVDRPAPPGVHLVSVESAEQMLGAVREAFVDTDIAVMAAAVADFRPVTRHEGKLKKHDGVPEIRLEPTPDILMWMGSAKSPRQILVGFAAETSGLVENARAKLERKNLDLIVANDVSAPGVGFGHDTNAVTILDRRGISKVVDLADKHLIARAILDSVVGLHREKECP